MKFDFLWIGKYVGILYKNYTHRIPTNYCFTKPGLKIYVRNWNNRKNVTNFNYFSKHISIPRKIYLSIYFYF